MEKQRMKVVGHGRGRTFPGDVSEIATVGDLIAKLSAMDPDAPVRLSPCAGRRQHVIMVSHDPIDIGRVLISGWT